ncbi:hypothetical protein ACFL0Z_01370 [Patescibacteria group bacterium]
MNKCQKCGMSLAEHIKCNCNQGLCCHCCECNPGCQCDCQGKK